MRGEFDLIARYFAPLASGETGAFGLSDDAAVLSPTPGRDLVYTLDTVVAGVHYLPNDLANLVARKLLRVNLSDLAAMGATPRGYLLSTALSQEVTENWIADFAKGLRVDQDIYGVHLLGGDTTRTPGPTSLSLTAIGEVPEGRALLRGGARPDDFIYVSGTIGDAALGLKVALGEISAEDERDRDLLLDRYRLPQPRVELGQMLLARGLASAGLDVSDGLVADLGHLCRTSGVSAQIEAASVPLSGAAQRFVEQDSAVLVDALTGGDDYELVFTATSDRAEELGRLAQQLGLPLTRIGHIREGEGVQVIDREGVPIKLDHAGWTHF